MRKLVFILMLSGIIIFQLKAQTENDALRYSFLTHGGTARYMGMSGAFGALGADFSSLSTNPAGIGTFRTSSFMFSPIFQMNSVNADYLGETSPNEKIAVNANNIGLIINLITPNDESEGWKSIGFGIGYNKLRSFNQDAVIKGYNDYSSRLDLFMLNSDGIDPNDLSSPEYTAFSAKLIDTIPNHPYGYYTHEYMGRYYIQQQKRIITSGGVGEYIFALGANYNDKFQMGVSMGIQNVRYKEKSEFTESSDSTDLASFKYTENLETKGTGFNLKLGFIYRPVEFFRIGAAFHTPTFFTMKDVYSYEAESHFRVQKDGEYNHYSNGYGEMEFSYELYTPMRVVVSSAFVFPKIGIISADYEYVRYNKSRLRALDANFDETNDIISSSFNAGHNFRLGAEIKLSPVYLRGGVSYYGSPDKKKANMLSEIKGYSFGAGIRTQNIYVDFGFNHWSNNLDYMMYDYGDGTEYSKLNYNEDMICVTVGFVF